MTNYGVGLDARLAFTFDQHRQIAREAADLGYTEAWTPAGGPARDAFHICAQWYGATADRADGGLTTGISVVPAAFWTTTTLAAQAGTVSELTGGRFILGIGTGALQSAAFQRTHGVPSWPPIAAMRDYLITLRGLLRGDTVDYEGKAITLRGSKLAFHPPPTPVFLAALGPQMLCLAGEAADGVLPNWSTPEQIAWARELVTTSARNAGRDPATIRFVQYIRVCIDEDEDAARRAFAEAVMPYAMVSPGGSKQQGYRAHFARMGFDSALNELEARRDNGASSADLIDAFPVDLMRTVGYFGRAEGAAAAFRKLAVGLDTALVRVVASGDAIESTRDAMRACRPELLNQTT